MNTKLFASVFLAILLGVLIYALLFATDSQPDQDNGDNTVPEQPTDAPITEQGTITCIPKLGTGPQTMECALGLQTTEGAYYGLRHLSDHDENFTLVSPGITVEVSGTLVHEDMFGPDNNRYDTVGIIEIDAITEI